MDVDAKPAGNALAPDERGTRQKQLAKEEAPISGNDPKSPKSAPSLKEPGEQPAISVMDGPGEQHSETANDENGVDASGDGDSRDAGDDKLTFGGIKAAVDNIDDNLDDALGHAADSIWSFATSVTGTVTRAVKEGPPDFENLRKNVTSRLAPLDTIGRDLSSQIGAFAPNEASIANITGSVKSVAESVQRNAQAMEAAILAKANQTESNHGNRSINGGRLLGDEGAAELATADPAMGVLPLMSVNADDDPEDIIDVNEEIAKVGETITNSFVGQTVGDIWTGLWGSSAGHEEGAWDETAYLPKTRFEKRIYELEANPDTYCEPAKDLDAFEEWSKAFVLDDFADSCIGILDRHESIAELYERVVPRIVEEETFWMRYFFARHVLEKEEQRRKRLLERAENTVAEGADDDDGWGDDDWDDDTQVQSDAVDADSGLVTKDGKRNGSAIPAPADDGDNMQGGDSVEGKAGSKIVAGDGQVRAPQNNGDETQASPNPAAKVEVVGAPADDWSDDDWE